jgi:diguanylate cyclase (GGDEF)-like protein
LAVSRGSPTERPLAKRELALRDSERATELREDTADRREEAVDMREEAVDLREEAADLREEAADLRENVVTEREKTLRPMEEAARNWIDGGMQAGTQLREANERLVVATVHAQRLAEAAEGVTVQMSHMAAHDFLTGLPNRSLLQDRLEQSIARAQRDGVQVALMFVDLDNFKQINDSLGHAVGDQLLQSTARRLQACVRLSDTVSRQGGDEFVVLLPEVEGKQGASLTAQKLIESMAATHLVDGHHLIVTLSIGISIYPDDGMDAKSVLENADIAMYQAKRKGRNNYQVFTSEMGDRAAKRRHKGRVSRLPNP